MKDLYIHQQNGFYYLMLNRYTVGIYSDIDRAVADMRKMYEVLKGVK